MQKPIVSLGVSPSRAEVSMNLASYRRNIMTIRDRLEGGAHLWAVVKANAYGHDVHRLAQEAIAAGAKKLCVATLSEARQLRQLGVRASMLIMGPLDLPSIRRAVELEVSFSVVGMEMLDAVEQAAKDGFFDQSRVARVHLKVDTGMGRWGVSYEDFRSALERLVALDGIELEGVMTHFATADDVNDGGFFEGQLSRFIEVVSHVRSRVPHVLAHAANSAATLRDARSHFDAVRCGVATYGLDPMQHHPDDFGLEPMLSLRSHVAHIAPVETGASTGYGRTWVADEECIVARIPIGYADGVRRSLGNRGHVLIRGVERPIVGAVSMDHLSAIVSPDVQVGDIVTIIGKDRDAQVYVEDHARWSNTINYEVTCGIANEPRLLRTYSQDV